MESILCVINIHSSSVFTWFVKLFVEIHTRTPSVVVFIMVKNSLYINITSKLHEHCCILAEPQCSISCSPADPAARSSIVGASEWTNFPDCQNSVLVWFKSSVLKNTFWWCFWATAWMFFHCLGLFFSPQVSLNSGQKWTYLLQM